MAQYSFQGVASPVAAGDGDRWLLTQRSILMKAVGLEDLSRTPAHVLLQPLRLAVYGGLGLSRVTEYMCVPAEQWRSWQEGRTVDVPPPPPKRERRSKKGGGGGSSGASGRSGAIDPAVKRLAAAIFAGVLSAGEGGANGAAAKDAAAAAAAGSEGEAESGAAAAAGGAKAGGSAAEDTAADDSEAPAAAAAAAPAPAPTAAEDAAAAEAAAAAAASKAAADAEAEAAADAAAVADGVEPAVRRMVRSAVAKAFSAAARAAAKAAKAAADPLPKPLPAKPLDLAQLLLRRLRMLDRDEGQFSKTHEKLLLLQVRWCGVQGLRCMCAVLVAVERVRLWSHVPALQHCSARCRAHHCTNECSTCCRLPAAVRRCPTAAAGQPPPLAAQRAARGARAGAGRAAGGPARSQPVPAGLRDAAHRRRRQAAAHHRHAARGGLPRAVPAPRAGRQGAWLLGSCCGGGTAVRVRLCAHARVHRIVCLRTHVTPP
jgi:hypothetical protein